jgi:hypothetical protein
MGDFLSRELRAHADQLEREYYEDLPAEEVKEQAETDSFMEELTNVIISCRETLTANDLAHLDSVVRDHRSVVDKFLDRHYTLRQLAQVPSLVDRTIRLSHLRAKDTPSAQTNRYLGEASRAFIMGLPLASVAMSRSALEQAIKERMGEQAKRKHSWFEALVDDAVAREIISQTSGVAAKGLAQRCNRAIHHRPVRDEEEAFEILTAVRSILEEIFR